MSGDIRVSKKGLAGIALGALIVAISGVFLGSWFIGWRQVSADQSELFRQHFNRLGIVEKGMQPPQVEIIDIDGQPFYLKDLVSGQNTVVLFMSVGCDPCTEAIEQWKEYAADIPEGLQVIGVNNGDCDDVGDYIAMTGMPYPVYCDTAHVLALDYGINQYPSIMGIGSDGVIAFLGAGMYEFFTPQNALELILENE